MFPLKNSVCIPLVPHPIYMPGSYRIKFIKLKAGFWQDVRKVYQNLRIPKARPTVVACGGRHLESDMK
jgi:hypothetical protein